METKRLRVLQEGGNVEKFLSTLVTQLDFIPRNAERIFEEAIPSELNRVILRTAPDEGWCCWRAREHVWLFFARMSLSQSRERGRVVLQVIRYDADGHIVESGWWMRSQTWQPLYQ